MSRAVDRIRWLALAVTLAGCGGEWIRLGDATVGGAGAGSGGASGFGNTGNGGASGSGGVAGSGGMGVAGTAGNAGCMRGLVNADEVLWIGDSWILLPPASPGGPGLQQNRVRDHARDAQAIGSREDYASRAAPATTMAMIAGQYDAQQRGATKVKVILMDGGTWDPIDANMKGESVPDAIATAVREFRDFLVKVETDQTVEHIVYFLQPPIPAIPMRDEIERQFSTACEESVVSCHFLDLAAHWEPEFTDGTGIQPSAAGAERIGDEIWKIMQQNCIAQ